MAFRTWGRLLLTALAVSLLAGAGQLGVAFGLGIVRLTGTFTGATVNQWPAQLVWAGWFAANAAVVGAVLTERLARRDGLATGTGRHLAVAGAAALGATVVAPLCMQPARAAELVSVDPVWAVGICAVLGALAGAGAALAVLLQPPVGWNMAVVAGVVWLLALLSAAPSLASTGQLPTVRLGVLEPAWLDAGAAQRLALVILPLVALLSGAATGGLARWRGQPPLVSGATGVAGPVLVAFAYLTAGPGDAADRYQLTPYYAALLAVAAGALGSAAAALLRWPLVARTAPTSAIEPTDILRPLPAGPALPHAPTPAADADEPATVDLADAGLRAAARPGGTTSGRTADAPSPRTAPAHWDWRVGGATASTTPAAAAPTAAEPDRTAGSPPLPDEGAPQPAGSLATTDAARPAGSPAEAAAARNDADEGTATRPDAGEGTVTRPDAGEGAVTRPDAGEGAATRPDAGEGAATRPDAGERFRAAPDDGERQPATAVVPTAAQPPAAGVAVPAEQPAAPATPAAPAAAKPRRTRKPRATRQPATAAAEGAGPAPSTTDSPAANDSPAVPATAPPAAAGAASPDAPDPSGAPATPATPAAAPAGAPPDLPAGGPTADVPVPPQVGAPVVPAVPGPPSPTAGAPTPRPSRDPAPAPVVPGGPGTSPGNGTGTTTGGGASTTIEGAGTTTGDGTGTTFGDGAGVPERDGAGPRRAPLFPADGAGPGRAGEPASALRPAWRPAPAWPAPPRVGPEDAADAPRPAAGEPTPEPAPRPRHLAPMPDQTRAANWDALATARRGSPAPVEAASGNGTPVTEAPEADDASPTEQPGGRVRGRLGLFRRNRSRAEDATGDREPEPLPAQDEEYVDWVTGLSRPIPDNEPEQESGRRSLRSTGRHHRD
ncbi:hypothetical protein ACGF7U_11770 [Micromonospora sp. NPDC047670]|uniref:hypothetical protein n=1 Tax=Micromonospora sp. NPDC047670 TaxID=3364252 RepID=UPI003722184B